MNSQTQKINTRQQQSGAALIVGLLLLVVITVLAVSGMNTATTELAMARNDQSYENAFQAAETGLENAMAQNNFNTAGVVVITPTVPSNQTVTATLAFEDPPTIADGYSVSGPSAASAYHFLATSQAELRMLSGNVTDRDATAVHTQAFYIVGPKKSSPF